MATLSLLLTVILLSFGYGNCHLCLISPRQRGPMDISMPGSPTCFRHGAPCGGQPPEEPALTLTAGETTFIKWQQNFNHYEPGYPGYMDISIAPSVESTDFTLLAVATDQYVHRQDYHRNYTALVTIPNITCDHCVIRARYNAHKPGESIFYQCADVKVAHNAGNAPLKYQPLIPSGKYYKPIRMALRLQKSMQKKHGTKPTDSNIKLYGFAFNPFEPDSSHYVSIDAVTGATKVISSFDFGIDSPRLKTKFKPAPSKSAKFMVDEVISVDYGRNTTYLLLHTSADRDAPAKRLYMIGSINGSMIGEADIFEFSGGAINGLTSYYYGTSLAFRIQPGEKEGNWHFEVGSLGFGGVYEQLAKTVFPESTYVNFQWFVTCPTSENYACALIGNENAPDVLKTRLYIFDLSKHLLNTCMEISVDPDQTARMRRPVWVYTGRKGHVVYFEPTFAEAGDAHGDWLFEVGTLDYGRVYTKIAETSDPETLYVNFQWLVKDPATHYAMALLGNENAYDALNSRLYIFDLYERKFVKAVDVDVSTYTFMSVHTLPAMQGMLYAFSPGLWADNETAWTLVSVSPFTGTVTKVCDVAPPGIFERHYGGSVYKGSPGVSDVLFHVLRVQGSDADMIVGVNPLTCDVTFSNPTNLRHVHSISRVEWAEKPRSPATEMRPSHI